MIPLISITVFLIYLNVPAVLVNGYGFPRLVVAMVPMLLVLPVAQRVLLRGESLRFPGMIIVALLMLICHTVSALISDRPHLGMDNVFNWLIEGVLLALILVNALRTRAEVYAAAKAIVAAGAMMGLMVIVQQVLGVTEDGGAGFVRHEGRMVDLSGEVQRRMSGPIGEVNRFAQVMAVLIPVAVGLAITAQGKQRWLYWTATLLICAGMSLAFSRGTLVALALVVPFALLFGLLRLRHLAVAALFGLLLLTTMTHAAERVWSIGRVAMQSLGLDPGGFRNADGASRGRMTEMQAAGLLFLDYPLLGAGPGMAPEYYPEYAVLVGGKVRAGPRRTHNLYLQMAAETGLIGLVAFLGMIWATLYRVDSARRQFRHSDRELWGLICGLELGVLVLLATSLFLHAAYIRYLWMLLALAVAAASLPGRGVQEKLLTPSLRHALGRVRGLT